MRAIDQVFSWNVVEQDYIKVYAENYSTDQLDFILQLFQEPHYQQLMQLDVEMIKDTLAVNEMYAAKNSGCCFQSGSRRSAMMS